MEFCCVLPIYALDPMVVLICGDIEAEIFIEFRGDVCCFCVMMFLLKVYLVVVLTPRPILPSWLIYAKLVFWNF